MNTTTSLVISVITTIPVFSQVPLTTSTNTLRHGDILCKIEVPYVDPGERGNESIWNLPEIPYDSLEWLQAINSNIDTVAIYESGRILHYFAHGDTLCEKGYQSPRAYKIYSQERPYLRYPFQYGDSISGCFKGECRSENDYFKVEGLGYTVSDGLGCLTDGEDTLRHVTRLHLVDDYVFAYADSTNNYMRDERFLWYCVGFRYAIIDSYKTSIYKNGQLMPIDSISYLYLPYMQLELAEDTANEELLAVLEAADAARAALYQGQGVGSLLSIDTNLSSDGLSVTINYQLSSDTDISFYACDITGTLLGSVQYQNREAGEWQDCIVLSRRPIGGTIMLRIDCGNERISLKVFQSTND